MCKVIPTAILSDSIQPKLEPRSQTSKSKTEEQIQIMAITKSLNKPDWKSQVPVQLGERGQSRKVSLPWGK